MKAREVNFDLGMFTGGFTFFPYQLAFGFSIRYWPLHFSPAIRLYFGPFKFWCFIIKKKYRKGKEE